mmetsp:Transcript_9588/g.22786  ORF Transcript_9588/g.22786 Transcript_9588/m.22786 type:complete len:215 (+) Transcript_9588:567-1211(+)
MELAQPGPRRIPCAGGLSKQCPMRMPSFCPSLFCNGPQDTSFGEAWISPGGISTPRTTRRLSDRRELSCKVSSILEPTTEPTDTMRSPGRSTVPGLASLEEVSRISPATSRLSLSSGGATSSQPHLSFSRRVSFCSKRKGRTEAPPTRRRRMRRESHSSPDFSSFIMSVAPLFSLTDSMMSLSRSKGRCHQTIPAGEMPTSLQPALSSSTFELC